MNILFSFLCVVLLNFIETKYNQYYTDGIFVYFHHGSSYKKAYVINGKCLSGDVLSLFGLIDSFKVVVEEENVVLNYFCDETCSYCDSTSFSLSECSVPDDMTSMGDFSTEGCLIAGLDCHFLFEDSQMKVYEDEFGVTFFNDQNCNDDNSGVALYYNISSTSACFTGEDTGSSFWSRPFSSPDDELYKVEYFHDSETCSGEKITSSTFSKDDDKCFPFGSSQSLHFDYYFDVNCEDGKINDDKNGVCNGHGVCMVDGKCECLSEYKTYSGSRVCESEETTAILNSIIIPVTSTTAGSLIIYTFICICCMPSCCFLILSLLLSSSPTYLWLKQFKNSDVSTIHKKRSTEPSNSTTTKGSSSSTNNNNNDDDDDKTPLLQSSSSSSRIDNNDERSIMVGQFEQSRCRTKAEIKIRKELFKIDWEDLKTGKKLGSGGSGALVVKGEYNGIDVAIKIFNTNYLSSNPEEHFFGEFEREVELLSGLRHPNIIMFYGASVDPPRVAYVTEYCSTSLYKYIEKSARSTEIGDFDDDDEKEKEEDDTINLSSNSIEWKQKIRIIFETVLGLSYLHSKYVIHRDVKCDNILLGDKLQVKIIDFGLSKIVDKLKATRMTSNVGTSYYMAPEIIKGEKYDNECDIYSLSIVMWEVYYEKLQPYLASQVKSARLIEARVAEDPNFRPFVEKMEKIQSERRWYIEVMKRCWDDNPLNRPRIQELKKMFTEKYGNL